MLLTTNEIYMIRQYYDSDGNEYKYNAYTAITAIVKYVTLTHYYNVYFIEGDIVVDEVALSIYLKKINTKKITTEKKLFAYLYQTSKNKLINYIRDKMKIKYVYYGDLYSIDYQLNNNINNIYEYE